ncbi:MAG: Shikimate kinase [Chlamydiia bacterium]|nr:Shikimate kinase [Chlamydiia bacterium]MCH9615636.1 Shikimate kinase [Chlamydiia bacterium]MCH9628961.1 Shikimate kinase [Chlamydiia bacterium]
MNIVLFGFKRCGKTYYGKKLAAKLNVAFIDTDDLLEKLHGMDVRTLYKSSGPTSFRKLEWEVIQGLQSVSHSVISLGGGAILTPDNYELLKTFGHLVYLETPKDVLFKRMLSSDDYPAFIDASDPEGSFNKMYEERLPRYEKIDANKVETAGLSDQQVLKKLEEIFHGK